MKKNIYVHIPLFPVVIALSVILFSLSACKKLIEIDLPIDQLTTHKVFSDSAAAESAVMGLYSRISYGNSNQVFYGFATLCPALSADELRRTTALPQEDEFTDNAIMVDNVTNYTIWRTAYSQIYHINSLLEQLAVTTVMSEVYRHQLMGELRFMRGLHYFYLTNLYGAVPLALSSDYRLNAALSRTVSDTIYKQVIADLKYAESILKPEYPSAARVRVNKWAASALLARVYLYYGEWEAATLHASSVIGSSMYQLESLETAFKANSREAILSFYPSVITTINTWDGSRFIPASGTTRPTYELTNQLLGAFEAGDLRSTVWVGKSIVSGTVYTYPHKYKVRLAANNTDKSEYTILLRLAELYLIRAEALVQQGKLHEAIADIDQIRKRADLPLLAAIRPAITLQELQDAIQHERQVELFAEWGHRWFDLKRTSRAEAVLLSIKTGFKPTALLYPIPQQDILVNPFLDQNMGY